MRHPEVKLVLWGAFIMRPPAEIMSEIKFHLIRWNWQWSRDCSIYLFITLGPREQEPFFFLNLDVIVTSSSLVLSNLHLGALCRGSWWHRSCFTGRETDAQKLRSDLAKFLQHLSDRSRKGTWPCCIICLPRVLSSCAQQEKSPDSPGWIYHYKPGTVRLNGPFWP